MQSTSQSTLGRAGALLSASLLLLSTAWASPRSDAWKLRRSDPEAALRGLQQAVRDDPNDAKAHWFMAMILDDLGRGAEGLQELEAAKRADPSQSFSTNPQGVANLEKSLSRKSGGSSGTSNRGAGGQIAVPPRGNFGRRGAASASSLNISDILKELERSNVWVAPGMQSAANASEIQNAISGAKRPVKVAIFDRLPGRTKNVGSLAVALHKVVFPRDKSGLVIVMTGQPRDVGIYGGNYLDSSSELKQVTDGAVNTFNTKGYAAGIAQIVSDADASETSSQRTSSTRLLLLVGLPTAGVILLLRRKKAKQAAELVQLREQTREMSSKLAPQYEKLDSDFEYAILGEADPQRKKQLQEMHARAGQAFSGAMKELQKGDDYAALSSGHRALHNAAQEMQRARNVLDGKPADANLSRTPAMAGGGGGSQLRGQTSADDDYEIPPIGTDLPGARNGYALDFFTSEPVPRDSMVPVEIEIGGQRRRVWASPQSAQNALNGQPQVATVNANGQQVPWYNAQQNYNPWNDWGSTMLNMMAMNMMMDSIFRPHYGFGYGGGWGGGYGGTTIINNYGDSSGHDNYGSDTGHDTSAVDYDGAGVSSLDSPFAGDSFDSGSAGTSSLDIFGSSGGGGGGGWGNDSS